MTTIELVVIMELHIRAGRTLSGKIEIILEFYQRKLSFGHAKMHEIKTVHLLTR